MTITLERPPAGGAEFASTLNIIAQFKADAHAQRALIIDEVIADGQKHRVPVEDGKPGNKDGTYCLHLDEHPAGWFENWRDGLGAEIWKTDTTSRLTPEARETHQANIATARLKRKQQDAERHARARHKAGEIWQAAQTCTLHPYLTRKGVQAYGLRTGTWVKYGKSDTGKWEIKHRITDTLLIPLYDVDGGLCSLQAIYPERLDGSDKDFLPGGRKCGCFYPIGHIVPEQPVCICEGYATGASIHEATGYPVIVAFDCGNLEAVARAMRGQHPAVQIEVVPKIRTGR